MTEVVSFRDYICIDCGKVSKAQDLAIIDGSDSPACPRCASTNVQEYDEAQHQDIEVTVPTDWKHPLEERARAIYERVKEMTGWREVKVRLWFQTPNPLLGGVAPEFMIMAGEDRCERLERFITEAEELNRAWHERKERDHGR